MGYHHVQWDFRKNGKPNLYGVCKIILKDIFPLIKSTCKNKNSCILFDLSNISCIFVAKLRSQAKYSEYDKKLLG